jgi:tetratricopeptide (TPR) repeat protein
MDRAMDIIRAVIPVLREQRGFSQCICLHGSIYRRKGDYISALDYYKKSLDLNKKNDKKTGTEFKTIYGNYSVKK